MVWWAIRQRFGAHSGCFPSLASYHADCSHETQAGYIKATVIPQLRISLQLAKMKRFAVFLISSALSSSVAFARPSGGVAVRDINVCNFASAVAINATGAADAINQLDVSLDNNWVDITHGGSLSISGTQVGVTNLSTCSWQRSSAKHLFSRLPGFPQVNCEFQGVDTAPVLNNGIATDSQVIFQVSPPKPSLPLDARVPIKPTKLGFKRLC